MGVKLDPLKIELFEKSLFIENNQFAILYSYEIKYEDYGYGNLAKSILCVQLENNIYSLRLLREDDQQLIVELNLEIKDGLVYLINADIKSSFKSDRNNRIQNKENIKFLILFFLSFISANSKELFFGAINQENKDKFPRLLS